MHSDFALNVELAARDANTKTVERIEHRADRVVSTFVDSTGLRYRPHSHVVKVFAIRKAYSMWVTNHDATLRSRSVWCCGWISAAVSEVECK